MISMSKKKDVFGANQLSLFEEDQGNIKNKKEPRPKNIPVTKKTDASASAFGWRFQVVVGIILSLHNIQELESVEIEGDTEDIELRFHDKDPEYIQVKAVQRNPVDARDNEKATLAMNTLINTSNITTGKYSKLVYVANFRNPLDLSDPILKASWLPRMDEPFVRSYLSLPDEAKRFIQSRIALAQGQLAKKYMSTTDYFDLAKLYIVTIMFESNDQDEQKYSSLEGTIDNFLGGLKLNLKRSKVHNIKNMFVNKYLADAGSKESSKKHGKITKEVLVLRMIFEIIDEVPNDFYDDVPAGISDQLDIYEDDFISQQIEDIDIINKVISGLDKYAKSPTPSNKVIKEFVEDKWANYKEVFPDDNELIQEYGIKMIILRILSGQIIIKRIKNGVNL